MTINSLQQRLIIILLFMVLIPTMVIGYVANNKANHLLQAQMVEGKLGQVNRVADRSEQYLVDNAAAITALSKNPSLWKMGSTAQTDAIKAFQEGIGSFELMFIVDTKGIIQNSFPHTEFGGKVDFTDRQWYKDVSTEEKTVISDTYISAFTKQATAPIVAPILDDSNKLIGYVGGNLSLGNLATLVAPLNQGKTGNGIVLDKKNFYLTDSKDEIKGKEHNLFEDKGIEEIIKSGKEQVITLDYQGVKKVMAFAPIGETGWSVLSMQNQSEALNNTQDLQNLLIILILLSAILAGVLGFLFIRTIVKPILGVVEVAEEIAQGNLNPQLISYSRQDEIGKLINAFKVMIQNLRGLVKQASDASQTVVASSEQLTASSEQSAEVANQVAVSIADVANGTEKQVKSVDETLRVVEKMSADIKQIAVNSNTVSGICQETAKAAENGGKAVNTAITQMDSIERTVNNSAQLVAQLGERSKEIGEIVNTISAIADQTNLLALNAAIEAARAGEQGRGFAVVAEEVRQLAEQSQDAAKHIAELIGEIQGDTERAVQAMGNGTREVRIGTEVVDNAGRSFEDIRNLLDQLSAQIRAITIVIEQTARGGEQIVDAVREVDQISQDIAGQTQTVSAATEEQLASMEEIASSSQDLAQMAQQLQDVVNRFRL